MDVRTTSATAGGRQPGTGVDLRQWRYFMGVTRHRSFSRAAAELGVSQPTLSQQIKELERRVGTALFVRDRQGVRLTVAGDRLVEPVRRLFAEADAVERTVRAIQEREEEPVRLRIGFAIAVRHPLPGRAVRFLRRSVPGASVVSSVGTATAQLARLGRGDLDLAVVQTAVRRATGGAFGPGLVGTSMGAVPLVAVMRPDHPLAGRRTVPLGELGAEREVLLPPECEPGLWDAVLPGIVGCGSVRTCSPEPDEGQLLDAVAADGGVALVGQHAVTGRPDEELHTCGFVPPQPAVPTYLVRSERHAPSVVLRLEQRLRFPAASPSVLSVAAPVVSEDAAPVSSPVDRRPVGAGSCRGA